MQDLRIINQLLIKKLILKKQFLYIKKTKKLK